MTSGVPLVWSGGGTTKAAYHAAAPMRRRPMVEAFNAAWGGGRRWKQPRRMEAKSLDVVGR